jgi:hypothetical protein
VIERYFRSERVYFFVLLSCDEKKIKVEVMRVVEERKEILVQMRKR